MSIKYRGTPNPKRKVYHHKQPHTSVAVEVVDTVETRNILRVVRERERERERDPERGREIQREIQREREKCFVAVAAIRSNGRGTKRSGKKRKERRAPSAG